MAVIRQTNFSGGELSPLLWGRTDLAKFAVGLRKCRNFFISKQGAAVSRPGTLYVGTTKDNAGVRLVPFIYADDQSYVLEFGDQYLRVWNPGGSLAEVSPGVTEIATPYQLTDLAKLQWAQSGDVLTLCHPSHEPRELSRLGEGSWTLTTVSFDAQAHGLPPTFVRLKEAPTEDAPHPAREWKWQVTMLWRDAAGRTYETTPFTITYIGAVTPYSSVPQRVVVYPDRAVTLLFSDMGLTQEKFLGYNVYRGRGNLWGLVGSTDDTARTFVDVGREPDYTVAPPQGLNPFKAYDASDTLLRTEKPSTAAFFEERRVFGGTVERPGFLFCSATGDYADFDERLAPMDSQSIVVDLASRKREEVRGLLGLDRLLVFTNSSVWGFGGTDLSPLTPGNIDAKVLLEVGSACLPPLMVDGTALFVRAKGMGVHGLVYDQGRAAGVDLSIVAQHIFAGGDIDPTDLTNIFGSVRTIREWCYAEDPWGLVWAVRSDGVLLSLTYSQTDQTWAWATHDTDGQVISICSIPDGDEDAVWLLVKRTIAGSAKFYIERMASRVKRGGGFDEVCVDCAEVRSGSASQTITGLEHLEGKQVYATSIGNPPYGPLTVVNGSITLPEVPPNQPFEDGDGYPLAVVLVGLLFTPELETLDVAQSEVRMKQKTVTSVGFEVDSARGVWVGPDFDNLTEWRQRAVSSSYGTVGAATELVRMATKGAWDANGRAALRQTLPLPVTVLGIAREVDFGS